METFASMSKHEHSFFMGIQDLWKTDFAEISKHGLVAESVLTRLDACVTTSAYCFLFRAGVTLMSYTRYYNQEWCLPDQHPPYQPSEQKKKSWMIFFILLGKIFMKDIT